MLVQDADMRQAIVAEGVLVCVMLEYPLMVLPEGHLE